jgi:hypothetical protein
LAEEAHDFGGVVGELGASVEVHAILDMGLLESAFGVMGLPSNSSDGVDLT